MKYSQMPSQAQVEQEAHLFETVLSSIVDFAYTFDREGRFTYANQALLNLWQLPLEEASGKTFFELGFPDELAHRFQGQIETVVSTGKTIKDETSYMGAAGTAGYYEYIFVPVFGANGEVEVVAGTTRDITKRKQMEIETQASEEQVRNILESITDGFFTLDREWRFAYANPQAERILGRAPGDLLGKVIWEVYPGLADSEFEQAYLRTANEQTATSFTAYYPDHARWYEVHAYPAYEGITVYFRNVTEHKQKEDALRDSEFKLRSLFDNAREAIGISVEGKIVFVNPAYAQLLGYTSPEEMIGLSVWASVAPSDRERLAAIAQQRQAGGAAPFSYEYRGLKKDGTECDLENYVSSCKLEGQLNTIVTTRDITVQKKAERASQFLSQASGVLASSLDYEQTLQQVADLAVPHIADWCSVDILEADGSVSQLAIAHVDPEKVKWAHELRKRYPPDPHAPSGLYKVLRTGQAEIYSHISDELLVAVARDTEHLAIIRQIGFNSAMIVPMTARGHTLGAITFVATTESGHHYREEDLELALGLASRAAIAIDNARLYRAAQNELAERRRVQAVLEAHQSEIEALNVRLQRSIQETHHRVKNNLQIISSLAELQVEEGETTVPAAAMHRIGQHTRSLAALHDILTRQAKNHQQTNSIATQTAMNEIIPLLQANAGGRHIHSQVADIILPGQMAASLVLLVSELISNAIKHGQGNIDLTLTAQDDFARLEVCDEGPGFPPNFNWKTAANTGLGLIGSAGEYDLRGTISFENRHEGGARAVVVFPLSVLKSD